MPTPPAGNVPVGVKYREDNMIECQGCGCMNESISVQCWFCKCSLKEERNANKQRLFEDNESRENSHVSR